MSLEALGLEDYEVVDDTLILDGDIVLYRPCCIFNDDSDYDRKMIKKKINSNIERLMELAGCTQYILFLTTKWNFRDYYVDDYKANRADVERPVNLRWAKEWAMSHMNTYCHKYMEADDLLGVYMTSNPDNTVLWSLDKDLRQVPGRHLDDESEEVKIVTEMGDVYEYKYMTKPTGFGAKPKEKKKIYFEGTLGLYFQMLTGDSTDHILGCAKRVEQVYKSGAKKGETYIKRVGVGPGAALKLLNKTSNLEEALEVVKKEYYKIHGDDWQTHLETQANLLFMVRKMDGEIIHRWTWDGREELFDISKGVYINDSNPKNTQDG